MEIIKTGELRRIEYEKTEDVDVTSIFQGIYGVGVWIYLTLCSKKHQCITHGHLGQLTAFKWYANGCRSLEDLKAGKGGVKLTAQQEIGIRFYDGKRTIFIVLFPLQRVSL
jgi:DNA polymerase lambda